MSFVALVGMLSHVYVRQWSVYVHGTWARIFEMQRRGDAVGTGARGVPGGRFPERSSASVEPRPRTLSLLPRLTRQVAWVGRLIAVVLAALTSLNGSTWWTVLWDPVGNGRWEVSRGYWLAVAVAGSTLILCVARVLGTLHNGGRGLAVDNLTVSGGASAGFVPVPSSEPAVPVSVGQASEAARRRSFAIARNVAVLSTWRFRALYPLCALWGLGLLWAVVSPTRVATTSTPLFFALFGFLTAELTSALALAHVCGDTFPMFHLLLIPLVAVNINASVASASNRFALLVSGMMMLQGCLLTYLQLDLQKKYHLQPNPQCPHAPLPRSC